MRKHTIKSFQLKFILLFFAVITLSTIAAFFVTTALFPLSQSTIEKIDAILVPEIIASFRLYNFMTIVFAIVLSTIIMTLTSRRVLRPIRKLSEGFKKVATGDFEVQLEIPNSVDEELALLTYNFNQMTQELSNMKMLSSDFIANVSHEFKTPLSAIHGYATLLEQGDLTPSQQEYVSIINQQALRLTHLSSSILKLTKLEKQTILTDQTTFALDEQIRMSLLLLQQQWEKKDITFHLSLDALAYYGSEELMQQVWINLLDNAIKFSPDHSEIQISCFKTNEAIQVAISDHGIGMDQTTLAHIFETFYQGDVSHFAQGNGLGLPLVKRIVELCNGHIEVTSIPNIGTTFTVFLPTQNRIAK